MISLFLSATMFSVRSGENELDSADELGVSLVFSVRSDGDELHGGQIKVESGRADSCVHPGRNPFLPLTIHLPGFILRTSGFFLSGTGKSALSGTGSSIFFSTQRITGCAGNVKKYLKIFPDCRCSSSNPQYIFTNQEFPSIMRR